MAGAGKRDKLVTIERQGIVLNEHEEETEAFAEAGKVWCAIYYGRGEERRRAASEQASQSATFQMPSNALTRALTTKDRLSFNGAWDITGIAPDTPRRGDIEITATRSA